MTLPHAVERDVVVPALAQLCREFPGITPRLLVSDEHQDLVRHKLDVAIYGGEPRDSNYRALPLGTMKEIICATPAYVQLHGAPALPEELHGHRWIAAHWQKSAIKLYRDNVDADAETIRLVPCANVNTLPCAVALALQHMGVVMVPDLVALPLMQSGEMVRVLMQYRGPLWPFHFIHPYQGDKPLHVARFYQLVKLFFAKTQAGG